MKKTTQGLTLIELMVVVAVIGIIAAVAYPSYQSQIRKSRRGEAVTMLQAAQLAQEKFRLNSDTYGNTADFATEAFQGVCKGNIASPKCESQNGYYYLTASGSTTNAYTLTATAQNGQERDTACTPLWIALTTATLKLSTPDSCWSK